MKKLYIFFAALAYTMVTYPVTVTNNLSQDIIIYDVTWIDGREIALCPFALKPSKSFKHDNVRSFRMIPLDKPCNLDWENIIDEIIKPTHDTMYSILFKDLSDETEITITQQMIDQYIQNERMRICCEKANIGLENSLN